MQEIWKDIDDYVGIYQVSNLGNVRSISYQGHKRIHLMTPKKHHSGYLFVMLCKDCIHKNRTVHSLVANAFIENPFNKPYVNHIDGNKHNNSVDNLEWVTAKENTNHAIKNLGFIPLKNRFSTGKDHHASKAVLQFSKSGEFIKK